MGLFELELITHYRGSHDCCCMALDGAQRYLHVI